MDTEQYRYKSTVVAKYIVARAQQAKIAMNMTKLQKLLYVAYGVYYASEGKRLMDEHPKAWPYGPVFPTTRNNLLSCDYKKYNIENDAECKEICTDEEMKILVDFVFSNFGALSAGQLSEWSHQFGSPWHRTTCDDGFVWNATIPDEYINEYFSRVLVFNND